MSLEEKTKEFMLEGGFNRENFVKTGKIYQDMGKWLQTLEKDATNVDVMRKSGKLFQENPDFYYQSGTSPRPRIYDTLSVLQDNRANYAKEKYSEIIGGFDDEHWMGLISNLPLYKTGKKKYDEVIEVINQKRQMDEVMENPEKMTNFLYKKAQKFDSITQAEFRREIYNERYLKTLFGVYKRETEIKYMKALFEEDGGIKKGLAKSVFEASLNTAKGEMEIETNESDKSDIWEADVRPYYLALDNVKYRIEKAKLEKDREKSKESTSKEREEKRKEKGMSI
jgi:hypothetical protein